MTETVKNGFSWPAFLFGPIWALVKGMAGLAAALFGVNAALILLLYSGPLLIEYSANAEGPIQLVLVAFVAEVLWFFFVGARGNHWRRKRLKRDGYEEYVPPEEGEAEVLAESS